MNRSSTSRKKLISIYSSRLFLPRFQMSFMLLLTGLVGFLSSFLLLRAGVSQMWLRYPLAIVSAYITFLLLLRLWLAYQRNRERIDVHAEIPVDVGFGGTGPSDTGFGFGGGGEFGGAGAGGNWDETASAAAFSGSDGGQLGSAGFDIDLEELGLLILAILALIGGLVASLYLLYIAPVLLGELLVDGVLVGGLYKKYSHIERKNWLQTAARNTLVPLILCVLCFGVLGWAMQAIAPEAKSIGEVWQVSGTGEDQEF